MTHSKQSNTLQGFLAGKPVTGNPLVGREQIVQQIMHLTSRGQSVVLVAPRRFGKTSVLLEVLRRFDDTKVYSGYIDFFSTPNKELLAEKITESVLQNKKLDSLFNKFKDNISELLRHIEFKQTIEEFDYILSFADRHKDPDKLLSASVDFINDFAVRHQHDMVCIFDEFGDLQKLDGTEIIKLFRAKIQQQQATYIFSGSYESVMNDLFISSHAPFYRFARIIKLGCIEKSAFKTYLSHVFKSLQINVEQASLDTILDFTGGHPYYTQLICQQIELEHATERTVKASQIADYIESAMWVEINYIETLWQELSKSRENVAVLVALAENHEKIYSKINTKHVNVARAIKRFEKNGIIEKRNKQYTVTDPLFLYWIKRKLLRKNKTECV